MRELPLEFRLAARAIRRRPWQPAVAAAALAIAIGGVGVTFAAVYGVAIRPLPYQDPSRVIAVRDATDLLSATSVAALRDGATSLASVSAYSESRPMFRDGDRARRIPAANVDERFLTTLGVAPSRGRGFTAADAAAGATPTVMVSHSFAERLSANGAGIGSSIFLDGARHTVIGVMPAGFDLPTGTAVWIAGHDDRNRSDEARYWVVARVKPAIPIARASTELGVIGRGRGVDRGRFDAPHAFHTELLIDAVRADTRSAFWMLVGIVAAIFLLTVATLANLFVARAVARSREIAVHAALGGTAAQLFRQQIAESVLICGTGAAVGSAIGIAAAKALSGIATPEWWPGDIVIDWTVLAAVATLALIVALVLALLPVLRFRDIDVQAVLRNGGTVTANARHRRIQGALLGTELATVMFLVVTAGTLGVTYLGTERIDWGYDTQRILLGTVALPQGMFEPASARLEVAARVAATLRGMRSAQHVTVFGASLPSFNGGGKKPVIEFTGVRTLARGIHATIDVDTAYFATMGIRILRGRGISSSDIAGAPPVAVIDERLARANWPDRDPIGQQIRLVDQEPDGPWYTIVGVASHAIEISSFSGTLGPEVISHFSVMYRSFAQTTPTWPMPDERFARGFAFAAHGDGNADAEVARVRAALSKALPDAEVDELGSLQKHFNVNGLATRTKALIFAAACAFGLLLCTIGVVGLVADSVARRTRELGIRIALGAPRHRVIALVLQESMVVGIAGVACGLALSIVVARVFGSYIFGFGKGIDNPVVVIGGMSALLAVVVFTAIIPAMRAAAVNPATALRSE